jgi:hypothetical protein
MTTADLWPDIKIDPKPRGVRQILEEAGAGLKQKTKGLVEFLVLPMESHRSDLPFRLRCYLRVEALDYNYFLLEVDSAATGFPVEVRTGNSVLDHEVKAGDEASLLAVLATVFRSEQTQTVIKNLISMATE